MPRIIGIDPGLVKTGWGVIDFSGNCLNFVSCGLIKPDSALPLAERLVHLANGISNVISQYQPNECAIEETFVNKNALSSLKLGHARGALMLAVSLTGLPISEYAATLVKKSITGVGRAEKNQVLMMVKHLMPAAKINFEDESDALAIAICHTSHASLNKMMAKSIALNVS